MTDQPKHKVVFLDRDGTINIDYGYVYKKDDWQWVPGAIEGMKMLQTAGYTLAVITNQSGIAHGMYSQQAMHDLHVFMEGDRQKRGDKNRFDSKPILGRGRIKGTPRFDCGIAIRSGPKNYQAGVRIYGASLADGKNSRYW